jgi:aspartyl/asparaginyl beta-hydroxylase (cupin superfamily)
MKEQSFWNEEAMQIPVCQQLVKNWEKIRDESLSFLNSKNPNTIDGNKFVTLTSEKIKVPKYEDGKFIEDFTLLSTKGLWQGQYIGSNRKRQNSGEFNWLNEYYEKKTIKETSKTIAENASYAIKFFKTFNRIIKKYSDDICSACNISVVSPGTHIAPHVGTNGFLRMHLCLVNDEGCSITVGDETKNWEEGKILAFKDGGPYPHSVNHNGLKDRVVIIFDLPIDYVKQYINSSYL